MIGWIITIVGSIAAGWIWRGKVEKKPAYKEGIKLEDEDL